MKRIVTMALALTLAGCQARQNIESVSLGEAEEEFVLVVVLDLSGSFAGQMAEDGKAYEFVQRALARYLQDKTGTRDRILFAQISGTKKPLLWEGTTKDLRRDFPSASAFHQFLMKRADPNGSRVNHGVCRAIRYVLSLPRVARGHARTVTLVLSDMEDNSPDAKVSEQELVDTLTDYARTGGLIGMYYVEQDRLDALRKNLEGCDFKDFRVEGDIVGYPALPSFE